jgi:iron complex transport system substrate-binding protein
MRIVSLVPSATEALFALGLGPEVVAVTHECDHPEEARRLPQVTRDVLPPGLSSAEIDRHVRERTERGESIYELDERVLAALEPDLIVTQALCTVCAVSVADVRAVAERLDPAPQVLALDPKTLGEALGDIARLAVAADAEDEAEELADENAERLDRIAAGVTGRARPTVVALEWLDPVFVAGHWTPQMIELAGGLDLLGLPGEPSEQRTWEEVAEARPGVVIVMPCGYDEVRALVEAEAHADRLRALGAHTMVAVDASSFFSRPGPRLVDGVELLAHVLHPEVFPDPPHGASVLNISPGARSVR